MTTKAERSVSLYLLEGVIIRCRQAVDSSEVWFVYDLQEIVRVIGDHAISANTEINESNNVNTRCTSTSKNLTKTQGILHLHH
jgi:hypothetical protein